MLKFSLSSFSISFIEFSFSTWYQSHEIVKLWFFIQNVISNDNTFKSIKKEKI